MEYYSLSLGMIGTNCYIVASRQGNAAIIDPGGQPERVFSLLENKNLKPVMILLTHGHFDHIGGVDYLRNRYSIPVYIHEDDVEMLSDPYKNGGLGLIHEKITAEYDRIMKDGDDIPLDELNFHVIHTPGHSKGSVCFQTEDMLLTGDTLFQCSIGRTDLYGGDYGTICQSLKKLRDLEGDRRVCPGHGPESTLNFERNNNTYLGKMSYEDLI